MTMTPSTSFIFGKTAFSVDVEGIPVPKGSQIPRSRGGKVWTMYTNDRKLRPWEMLVREAVRSEMARMGIETFEKTAIQVRVTFYFPRPKTHFTVNGAPSSRWCEYHKTKANGDLDKLLRAVLDALQGVVYKDDGQVCEVYASRVYDRHGSGQKATITVITLD